MPADKKRMAKTEDILKNTLLALMEKHTLEKLTVSDICKEAHVNPAVFYAYFTDKYDLLNYCRHNRHTL